MYIFTRCIHETGRVLLASQKPASCRRLCVDILKTDWSPAWTLQRLASEIWVNCNDLNQRPHH